MHWFKWNKQRTSTNCKPLCLTKKPPPVCWKSTAWEYLICFLSCCSMSHHLQNALLFERNKETLFIFQRSTLLLSCWRGLFLFHLSMTSSELVFVKLLWVKVLLRIGHQLNSKQPGRQHINRVSANCCWRVSSVSHEVSSQDRDLGAPRGVGVYRTSTGGLCQHEASLLAC